MRHRIPNSIPSMLPLPRPLLALLLLPAALLTLYVAWRITDFCYHEGPHPERETSGSLDLSIGEHLQELSRWLPFALLAGLWALIFVAVLAPCFLRSLRDHRGAVSSVRTPA